MIEWVKSYFISKPFPNAIPTLSASCTMVLTTSLLFIFIVLCLCLLICLSLSLCHAHTHSHTPEALTQQEYDLVYLVFPHLSTQESYLR